MPDRTRGRRYGAALPFLLATCLAAQESAAPSFRVSAELVVVDLVATARTGQFVSDLVPSDVQVFEDGKPQRIEFLRLVRTAFERSQPGAAPGVVRREPVLPDRLSAAG